MQVYFSADLHVLLRNLTPALVIDWVMQAVVFDKNLGILRSKTNENPKFMQNSGFES